MLPETAYFVMLGFGDAPPCAFLDVARRIAERAGGTVDALPHVTVAYLRGAASPEEVSMALAGLSGPRVEFRARGLFAFSDEPHPLFGHAAFLDVERTAALRSWHLAAREAIAALPLALARSWPDSRPHLRLAINLPRPLSEARPLLADLAGADLTLRPTHLHVSKLENATFVECLCRPLRFR
jgi:hypothetical protein